MAIELARHVNGSHGKSAGKGFSRLVVDHDAIPNHGCALLVRSFVSSCNAIHAHKALGVWELGKNELEDPQDRAVVVSTVTLQAHEAIGLFTSASSFHNLILFGKQQGVAHSARLLQDKIHDVKVEFQINWKGLECIRSAIVTENSRT